MAVITTVTPTVNTPRSRGNRTKSGCRTCKIRKVKCDETWPICNRCQSTGRNCDGYGIWGGGGKAHGVLQDKSSCQARKKSPSHRQDLIPITLPQTIRLVAFGTEEQKCFDWFVNRSTGKLYGAFFSNNWTTLLYQAMMSEPAIRHAVLALSSAHREEVVSANPDHTLWSSDDALSLFTVNQYSTAIKKLEPCFSNNGKESIHVLLISCALFVPMEFLRGNYSKGVLHLDHGLQLLHETATGHGGKDPSLAQIDGWLITILTRHIVQAKLWGQKFKTPCWSLLSPLLHENIDTFKSIHHARRSLENVMLLVFGLEEQTSPLAIVDRAAYTIDSVKTFHNQLQLWSKIADTTLMTLEPTHNFMDCFAYRLLRLYHDLTTVLVDTSLPDSDESTFDQCHLLFLNIIRQCIDIYNIVFAISNGANKSECSGNLFLHYHNPKSASGKSVSDVGWIGPLYFTALKCRNHRIRNQALLLMQSHPHKEGIWDGNLASAIARKVIEMEEGDFYANMSTEKNIDKLTVPSAQDLATPILPAEFRLSNIDVMLPEGRNGILHLTCSRTGKNGNVERISRFYDLASQEWYDGA